MGVKLQGGEGSRKGLGVRVVRSRGEAGKWLRLWAVGGGCKAVRR